MSFQGIIGSGVLAAGGGGGFTPPGSPFLHLDPTDSGSITEAIENGNLQISDWQDTNGGITYTQSVPAGSALNNRTYTVPNGLNSLTTIRSETLTTTNGILDIANSALGQNVGGVTLGVVANASSIANGGIFYASANTPSASTHDRFGIERSGANTLRINARRVDGDSESFTTDAMTDNTFHYIVVRYFYSSGQVEVRIDGAVTTALMSFTSSGTTSNTVSLLSRLGAAGIGAGTVEYGDILVYHTTLDTDDTDDLETFFTDKWGL